MLIYIARLPYGRLLFGLAAFELASVLLAPLGPTTPLLIAAQLAGAAAIAVLLHIEARIAQLPTHVIGMAIAGAMGLPLLGLGWIA